MVALSRLYTGCGLQPGSSTQTTHPWVPVNTQSAAHDPTALAVHMAAAGRALSQALPTLYLLVVQAAPYPHLCPASLHALTNA